MNKALIDTPKSSFAVPQNIVTVRIDRKSGLLSSQTDSSSRFEYFDSGTEPTTYAEFIPKIIEPNSENGANNASSFQVDGELF